MCLHFILLRLNMMDGFNVFIFLMIKYKWEAVTNPLFVYKYAIQ